MEGVPIGRVTAVGMLEGERQRVGPRGNDYQVDMVGHEAVSSQGEVKDPAVLAEKVHVDEAVGIGFEDRLAPVASLSDVVRGIEGNHPSETCHDK
jgi:hypothetical protein